jgi:hypothetical protein
MWCNPGRFPCLNDQSVPRELVVKDMRDHVVHDDLRLIFLAGDDHELLGLVGNDCENRALPGSFSFGLAVQRRRDELPRKDSDALRWLRKMESGPAERKRGAPSRVR